jgi:hypothetical protein
MFGDHFYNATIRRFVSVFGTLFNDIKIVRSTGTSMRVPLAYGPKEKFLARLDQQPNLEAPKVAIKLPRMSFEILNIAYDTQSKLNRNNKIQVGERLVYTYAPYNISLNLSIMAKNQDDALQILEQIVPYFQPEYTVTIKEGTTNLIKSDVPITLSSIDMTEDYEGDFMSRRAIIYTLSFDAKVRFYGPTQRGGVIKKTIINTLDINTQNGYERQIAQVEPRDSQSYDNYQLREYITEYGLTDRATLELYSAIESGNGIEFIRGEIVRGANTDAAGIVYQIFENQLVLVDLDGVFVENETVIGQTSGAQRMITIPSHFY